MLRLITDFDGPIMDVSDRYYLVYQHCLTQAKHPGQRVQLLSKAEFWQLKRSRVPEQQIGLRSGLDEAQAVEFARLRRTIVHTLPYLAYDSLIPGSVAALERIQQAGADIAIMTMRRTWELKYVFQRYDLERFFPADRWYCLSDDYIKNSDVKEKPLLMAQAIQELPPASETWMVGDTEADIVAAQTYGVKVIALLSGIRDRAQLERYQPNLIVNNLSEAIEVMLDQFWQQTG